MPRFRNAANSFNEGFCNELFFPFRASTARASRCIGARFGVAVAHQLHEFLRSRLVAAAGVAALLRHRAANSFGFQGIFPLDPEFGRAKSCSHTIDVRLAGVAGAAFAANDVALSHDGLSFVGVGLQRGTAQESCTAFALPAQPGSWVVGCFSAQTFEGDTGIEAAVLISVGQ